MKTMNAASRQYGLRVLGIVTAGFLSAGALLCQSPRIRSEVSSSATTVLQGSKHPLALAQLDAGRMPGVTKLEGVTLYFSRSAAQKAALEALLAAQYNPSSPQYHKWITPDQFAARFGMAQSDIEKVQAWLEQQGFTVDSVTRSRTGIRFTGTASQVESAFKTEMHYYTVDGQKHFAPSSDLSLPAGLGGVVAGVRNLDDFRPKAQHVPIRRAFTSAQSGNVFFAPPDIVTAYDIQPLYTAGVNGAGQTIAIMGQTFVDVKDIEAFQNASGITPTKDPELVYVPGTGGDGVAFQGDESESDLDLEWSGAIAPGANIVFVYTGASTNYGVFDSVQYAVDNLIGNIISLSYAACETNVSTSNYTTLDQIFQQAATQGQTVMSASGDQGSTACFGATNLTTAQQEALAVNYPASSAYVTGVGGTEAQAADVSGGSSVNTFWNAASGSDLVSSLIMYLPEVVWNDDPTSGCPTGANCLSSTGGGTSTLVSKPSWQTGVPGIPSGTTMRLVPDISFYSSPQNPGYLYCTSDQSAWNTTGTPAQTGSCNSGFRDGSSGDLTVAGGTSFATPIFAGMVALLNQNGSYGTGVGAGQGSSGEINQTLYTLASNSTTYAAAFHDVTSGNNFCLTPTNCASNGSTLGFSANAGYDQVTGLGSVDLAKLAKAWPVPSPAVTLIPTTTNVSPSSTSANVGDNVTFTITVTPQTGSTSTLTGTVNLQIDGGTAWGAPGGTTVSNQTLTNGALTYTTSFTGCGGTHQVLAQYSGDGVNAASTGIAQITVTGKCSFSMGASNVTVSRGASGSSTVTVTPSGGYTGTVVLTFDFGSQDSTLGNLCYSWTTMDSNGNGSVQVSGTAAATTQLTLDTNASDCVSSAAVKGKGMHSLGSLKGAKASNSAPQKPADKRLPAGLAFAGVLLAGLLARHSRKLRNAACVVALAAAFFAMNACGSSSGSSSGGPSNPPKGTYAGTITGVDSVTSTVTTTTSFTLTIN